jgi:hypothetical protein
MQLLQDWRKNSMAPHSLQGSARASLALMGFLTLLANGSETSWFGSTSFPFVIFISCIYKLWRRKAIATHQRPIRVIEKYGLLAESNSTHCIEAGL